MQHLRQGRLIAGTPADAEPPSREGPPALPIANNPWAWYE
jgi:hypothetical protein